MVIDFSDVMLKCSIQSRFSVMFYDSQDVLSFSREIITANNTYKGVNRRFDSFEVDGLFSLLGVWR